VIRRSLLTLALCLVLAVPAQAARQFDGIDDTLVSGSLTFGSPNKVALSMWFWWDSQGTSFNMMMESGTSFAAGNGGFLVTPDWSGPVFMVGLLMSGNADYASISSPSTGSWHHLVVNFDGSVTANHVASVYLDGSSQTVTPNTTTGTTGTLGDSYVNFMSRDNTNLFGAGRLADIAIYTGINLSGGDVTSLNGGTLPTSVQSGNLTYYWKLCGTASPEPATTGSVDLTLHGAPSQVDHPAAISASCSAAAPPNFFPRRIQGQ
jgi:hypothetical protein